MAGSQAQHTPTVKFSSAVDRRTRRHLIDALYLCDSPRRLDRQLQRPAQGDQIGVPRTAMVAFPEVDARYANANPLGKLRSRQPLLVSSVPKIASERRFSSQGTSLQSHECRRYIKMVGAFCKAKFVDLPIFHKLAERHGHSKRSATLPKRLRALLHRGAALNTACRR